MTSAGVGNTHLTGNSQPLANDCGRLSHLTYELMPHVECPRLDASHRVLVNANADAKIWHVRAVPTSATASRWTCPVLMISLFVTSCGDLDTQSAAGADAPRPVG